MASGLGKTVTTAHDAKRWRSENGGGRALFLCHNNDILYQAKSTFQAVNGTEHTYGYFHGEEKNLHAVDFLFASFQTMEKNRDIFDPREFDYIVVDESHHSHAETYRPTIEYFKPKFLLGATATPDRLDELDIREIFGNEVYYLPLEEALARGLVTSVDYRLLTDEIQISKVLETEGGKVSLGELNRKIFIPRRDEEIAKLIAGYASEFEDPRIMIFCASISHCDHLSQVMPGSFAIHSKTPSKERPVKLEMFRQGMIGTVLTVDAFNEGVDIPQANIIVFLRSTISQNIFLQQLGRGLRKSNGKDKVIVLDFVGNCERVRMVYQLWRKVEDTVQARNERQGSDPVHGMILNVESVEFAETIVPLLNLMNRIKPPKVSEVEHLAKEYSSRNSFTAEQVSSMSSKKFWWKCLVCEHEWETPPRNRMDRNYRVGTGCPACAGRVVTERNCLAYTHPRLAAEYSSRNPLPPTQIMAGTRTRLWWKCTVPDCGCEWQVSGCNRVSAKTGCPGCSNRVVTSKNNLAVQYPDLVREYSSRNELPPDKVVVGSHQRVWWKCETCGHEWQAVIYSRTGKEENGCPACSNRVATASNNLTVTHPRIAAEYSSRNKCPAEKVVAFTNQRLWWECKSCGHMWQATGNSRAGKDSGCPGCDNKVVTPKNNLAALYPELAREYSSRNKLSADQIVAMTEQRVWWQCLICGREWKARPAHRISRGWDCRSCAARSSSQKRQSA